MVVLVVVVEADVADTGGVGGVEVVEAKATDAAGKQLTFTSSYLEDTLHNITSHSLFSPLLSFSLFNTRSRDCRGSQRCFFGRRSSRGICLRRFEAAEFFGVDHISDVFEAEY